MTHSEFIKLLGGAGAVAEWMTRASQKKISRDTVYKWQANDVPWRWRPYVAKLASEKRVKVPKGFIPGVAA